MENIDNKNPLIYDEKNYFTKDERILYIKMMIEEAEKQENSELANYYRVLLKNVTSNVNDGMADFLINHKKKR
ncbi:MAG: hypothetical protein IJZ79_05865 [Bacilli bacterium]|nr:hypothetical protein [Bacilli bacterium]